MIVIMSLSPRQDSQRVHVLIVMLVVVFVILVVIATNADRQFLHDRVPSTRTSSGSSRTAAPSTTVQG
jgi:hypothetical protein